MVIGACNVAFTVVAIRTVDRLGRRPLMIWPRLVLIVAALPIFQFMVSEHSAFALLGGANLFVAFSFTTDQWVNFKLFGGIGLMLAFTLAQGVYLSRYIEEPKPGGESRETPR